MAPIIAHSVCNHLGFPNFGDIFLYRKRTQALLWATFVLGLVSWVYLLYPLTDPTWFGNEGWTDLWACIAPWTSTHELNNKRCRTLDRLWLVLINYARYMHLAIIYICSHVNAWWQPPRHKKKLTILQIKKLYVHIHVRVDSHHSSFNLIAVSNW